MTVLLLGIGHPDRGDDGAGAALIAALRGSLPTDVRGRYHPGNADGLLAAWEGAEAVLVVDAALGGPPGSIQRIDLLREELAHRPNSSSHGLGLAEAVALGRVLDALPARLHALTVSADPQHHGRGLSPAVAAAMPALRTQVLTILNELLAESPCTNTD